MSHTNPKIFIVEDDVFYAEIIAHKLQANQFSNVEVHHSGDALENNLHKMPDIILLDYHLENTTGLHLLKKIKAFNPNIQVIFLSAQEDMKVTVNSLKYGAFDYLEKKEESLDKIVKLIGRICLLNEELSKKKKRFSFFSKLKKIASIAFVALAALLINAI